MLPPPKSFSVPELSGLQGAVVNLVRTSPTTWNSAVASNLLIFLVGSPILVWGLSASGIGAALLLGILTWRAFGGSGFLLVATYFVILNNDVVNVINISIGSILAVLMQQLVLGSWH